MSVVVTLLYGENTSENSKITFYASYNILTAGAAYATHGRSFSKLERIKTLLRSRMSRKRLNYLSILYDNKSILDGISLNQVTNEFVDH